MKKHLYRTMTRDEVNEAVLERRVVLIPAAAIEQHGPHLPIDTDNLIGIHICEEAARRRPDLLVSAPAIHYGYNEHNMDFPGTISIKPQTLLNFYFDVGESFARQGFERIIYVNCHGGNAQIANLAARMVVTHTPALAAMVHASQLAWEAIDEIRESRYPGGMSHAGELETSVYLYLHPELVVKEKIQDEYPSPRMNGWFYVDMKGDCRVQLTDIFSRNTEIGIEGAATLASADKGEKLVEAMVTNLISIATGFRDMEVPPRKDFRAEGAPKPDEMLPR